MKTLSAMRQFSDNDFIVLVGQGLNHLASLLQLGSSAEVGSCMQMEGASNPQPLCPMRVDVGSRGRALTNRPFPITRALGTASVRLRFAPSPDISGDVLQTRHVCGNL